MRFGWQVLNRVILTINLNGTIDFPVLILFVFLIPHTSYLNYAIDLSFKGARPAGFN